MSPSVFHKSRMGRHVSRDSTSPVRGGASSRNRSPSRRVRPPDSSPIRRSPTGREKSPHRRSLLHRERSPSYHKSSRRSNSPRRDKQSSREKLTKHRRSSSPMSRSPSPRAKRLKRPQAERETERKSESQRERDHVNESEKTKHRERERDDMKDKRVRRLGRDRGDGGSEALRHRQSSSPSDHHHHNRHQSPLPPPLDSNSRGADQRDDEDDSLSKMKAAQEELDSKKKQKPSFAYSGKLAEETNRVRGITLLFNEPPDARKPTIRWRLYVFKGGEVLNEPLYVHRNSCYLFGRERRIADIPTDHPSCSKQHAVLQYRQVEKELPDGAVKKEVRPYVMDLGSTNKTFLNDNPIEPQRYYELLEKDVIKFGNSSREYVLLHEQSAT